MEPSLLQQIEHMCLVLEARLDGDVFKFIRKLGIGQRIHTRRGTRAGCLFRKWYNLPAATSVDAPCLAPITVIGSHHPNPTTPVVTVVGALNPASATHIVTTPTQSSIIGPLDTSHVHQQVPASARNLNIMLLNGQSCGNKYLEFTDTLIEECFDMVLLSETWFTQVGD
jgi:hypothetical protein